MILFRSGGSDTISVSGLFWPLSALTTTSGLTRGVASSPISLSLVAKGAFDLRCVRRGWAGLGEGVFHRCGVAVPTGRQSGQSEETHSPGASVVVCRISPVNPVNRGGLGGSNVDSRTDLKRKLVSPARGKGRRGRGQRILGLASSIWALASAPAIAPMVCTASATPSPMPALVEIRWENESLDSPKSADSGSGEAVREQADWLDGNHTAR